MSGPAIREMVTKMKTPELEQPEPKTPGPEAKAAEPDPGEETASETQQAKGEKELPRGVQKRLGKLDEEDGYYKGLIDAKRREIEARKKELADLDGKPGAEPEKSPKPASNAPPEEPDIDTFEGSNAEFKAATKKWKADYREWMRTESRSDVRAELEAERHKAEADKAISDARTRHGEGFDGWRQTVAKAASPALQSAISDLDDWSAVVKHFGENPGELAELNEMFDQNPVRAVVKLGKLEDRLTAAVKPEETAPKREKLPPPIPASNGNSAAAKQPSMDDALKAGDIGATRRLLKAGGYLPDRKRI